MIWVELFCNRKLCCKWIGWFKVHESKRSTSKINARFKLRRVCDSDCLSEGDSLGFSAIEGHLGVQGFTRGRYES